MKVTEEKQFDGFFVTASDETPPRSPQNLLRSNQSGVRTIRRQHGRGRAQDARGARRGVRVTGRRQLPGRRVDVEDARSNAIARWRRRGARRRARSAAATRRWQSTSSTSAGAAPSSAKAETVSTPRLATYRNRPSARTTISEGCRSPSRALDGTRWRSCQPVLVHLEHGDRRVELADDVDPATVGVPGQVPRAGAGAHVHARPARHAAGRRPGRTGRSRRCRGRRRARARRAGRSEIMWACAEACRSGSATVPVVHEQVGAGADRAGRVEQVYGYRAARVVRTDEVLSVRCDGEVARAVAAGVALPVRLGAARRDPPGADGAEGDLVDRVQHGQRRVRGQERRRRRGREQADRGQRAGVRIARRRR